jgi:hypothetical protein
VINLLLVENIELNFLKVKRLADLSDAGEKNPNAYNKRRLNPIKIHL